MKNNEANRGTLGRTDQAQLEIVGQLNDYAFDNPGKTFEEIVLKEFGPDLFPPTPQRRLFES
jgi:hypothetical protein